MTLVYLLLCMNVFWANADLGFEIKKCKTSDDECITANIQNVMLAQPADKPIEIKEWHIESTEVTKYDIYYTNLNLYNFHQTKIEKAHLEVTGTKVVIDVLHSNPEISGSSDYEIKSGTLYGLDVTSVGKVTYTHKGYKGKVQLFGEVVKKGDEEFVNITHGKLVMTAADKLTAHFETKDPKFDEKINEIFNEHWEAIVKSAEEKYAEIYAHVYKEMANYVFEKMSYKTLFF